MANKKKKNTDKEFGLSSWAINNKTTMNVLILVFFYVGITAFFSMPRENFPEVNETKSILAHYSQEILLRILKNLSQIH